MAVDSKNDRGFIELEYLLRKYFNENCAAVVSGECKFAEQKRVEEYARSLSQHPVAPGQSGVMNAFMTAQQTNRSGEWSSKTSDDLVAAISKRLKSDGRISGDLKVIAAAWRTEAVGRLGKKEYDRLSAVSPVKDLASEYVMSSFNRMVVEQMARSRVPQSSVEYILRKGGRDSLLGFVVGCFDECSTETDQKIDAMADELYNASQSERLAAGAVTLAMDAATLGGAVTPTSLVGKSGAQLTKAQFSNAIKGAAVSWDVADAFLSHNAVTEFTMSDKRVSEALSGDASFLSDCRKGTSKVRASGSHMLHIVNAQLSCQVRLPEYKRPFSPHEQKQFEKAFLKVTSLGGDRYHDFLHERLKADGLAVSLHSDVPLWMQEKSAEDCLKSSAYYAGIGYEMRVAGKKEIDVNGQHFTFQEVLQRAFDYSRAAKGVSRRESDSQHQPQANAADAVQEEDYERTATQEPAIMEKMRKAQGQWGGVMESMGLDGAGEMGKNLGYTLAMLPDMIYGMLTGQSKNLKIENNVFPLMCIFGGMFVKNPILRLMFLAFGGINMLNKGFKEHSGKDETERNSRNSKTVYRRYPDEPASGRIQLEAIPESPNDFSAIIDGKHYVCTLDNDSAEAFRNGALPKGTLANAVLRDYDEQQKYLGNAYERMRQSREEENVVVSLGVG